MKVFIVDNFDSFTYNLVHIVEQFASKVIVKRNNNINLNEIESFDKIIFSPGPGLPADSKIMFSILDTFKTKKTVLGVCLGHQAIAEYFGAGLINMNHVTHGRDLETRVIIDDYIYSGIERSFVSGRYHSWVVNQDNLPEELEVTAIDKNNQIMSLKHKIFDIRGVQYHPESVMTKQGVQILKNWIEH
ncbi:MAG: aminodeoxychorismate/anthranilate synthase component II [Bacteroidetes bacterium GWC2_33_15]|nr:MAG: aminodeoxychorismate/anthranilate synthase component II [Bacteroidetes bacterium GWA2_33_15]OFX50561.1 MAG: aminodeoxychorismate/anthranilate synthase component II [Bacteroidetes bacterium GWC2_33_15]OFX64098.1 MAG: aminodeoxychorismate/anthranilate synthase component II [Bacteroidetes bacterium GWB2_32_14]OFX69710.1 MAG: aminodeoxychorismate/anthranilate synthase component II [Bacteroidetes bacterium GWD2_33_33]HAN19743.1 aminodeoxychorismate/anthranilate synthase component II [Bactero